MITKSDVPQVKDVLDAFGPKASVEFDLLYIPDSATMREGYASLRRIVVWASQTIGRLPPEEAQVALRFLRDHWGSDEDRLAATKKHRPSPGSSPTTTAPGASPASNISSTPAAPVT